MYGKTELLLASVSPDDARVYELAVIPESADHESLSAEYVQYECHRGFVFATDPLTATATAQAWGMTHPESVEGTELALCESLWSVAEVMLMFLQESDVEAMWTVYETPMSEHCYRTLLAAMSGAEGGAES